ncbi:GTPase [Nocardiopsis coralliicola]
MTTQRNPAHADEGPDGSADSGAGAPSAAGASKGSNTGEWSGYVVPDRGRTEAPEPDPGAGWLPRDAAAAADAASGERPARGGAEQAEPARTSESRGRHAAPRRRRAAEDTRADGPQETAADGSDELEDDPENLAGWVGSLTEAVDDDTRIAGRRTGEFPSLRTAARMARAQAAADGGADPDSADTDGDRARAGDAGAAPADGAGSGSGDAESAGGTWLSSAAGTAAVPESGTGAGARAGGEPDDGPDPAEAPAAETDSAAADTAGAEQEEDAGDAPPVPPWESEAADGERDGDEGAWPAAGADDHPDDDEYQPTTGDEWEPLPEISRTELVQRLDGLATALDISGDDLPAERAAAARHTLNHAGARLRLSADHTVVALAGGTGSGKSSLFNAVSGLEFSRVGITRPTTSHAHACVWGNEGAEELLDWLGVPSRHRHSRTSELDTDTSELAGLILLDLPDHDSVRAVHTAEADRLIGAADLLIWVLDPQKYADAAVHHRYLAEMAGYGAVTVAVLNQVDRVAPDELEELLTDLRRLLESESGVHPRVLTTSTLTGQGIRELRAMLTETVSGRRASVDRLVADLHGAIEGFDDYRPSGGVPESVPAPARRALVARLLDACGADALADSAETAFERQGVRRVGWPITRWLGKLRRDPVRAAGMEFLREDSAAAGPVPPQEAEVEKAAVAAADSVGTKLPAPWPKRLRAAARAKTGELPEALAEAVGGALPDNADHPGWWSAVRTVQYLLVALAGLGLVWAGLAGASWFAGGFFGVAVLDSPVFALLGAGIAAAALLAGWLTALGCRNLVAVAASQRREEIEAASTERVRTVAERDIAAPIDAGLADCAAFAAAVDAAAGRTAES